MNSLSEALFRKAALKSERGYDQMKRLRKLLEVKLERTPGLRHKSPQAQDLEGLLYRINQAEAAVDEDWVKFIGSGGD